jgi:hypothetical protein
MGWDATFYFPNRTDRKKVEEFLALLGYRRARSDSISRKLKATPFYYPAENDPGRLSGVTSLVMPVKEGGLIATSRANIWCSFRDTEIQNHTLKSLRRFFGGNFESDLGRNRYFKNNGINREGLEAACFLATFRFLNSVPRLLNTLEWSERAADRKPEKHKEMPWLNMMSPPVFVANVSVVFLVSLLEDFFKSIMVEILKEEGDLVNINRFSNLSNSAVARVRKREITIEDAMVEGLSFQNVKQLRKNFTGLRVGSIIDKFLGEPLSRRGKNTKRREQVLQEIFDRRHRLVHDAEVDDLFLPADMMGYVRLCDRMVRKLYRTITIDQKWAYEEPD